MVAGVAGSPFHDDHTLPGTESQAVADKLASAEDQQSRDSVSMVFRTSDGDVTKRPEVEQPLGPERGTARGCVGAAAFAGDEQPQRGPYDRSRHRSTLDYAAAD